jgi:hypothetical protein
MIVRIRRHGRRCLDSDPWSCSGLLTYRVSEGEHIVVLLDPAVAG